MKAIIMAGGEGTRLRPLTCNLPKPMIKILDKPILEYNIELLKKYGIYDIGITLHYRANDVINYFGDGSRFGVKIEYFIEQELLGTAGSVKNAEDFLTEKFIVLSGDCITDLNLDSVIKYHETKGAVATIVLKEENDPLEYGVVVANNDGKIEHFLEKPNWSEVISNKINTGIYVFEPDIFSFYEKNRKFDFSRDLFRIFLSEGIYMYGYAFDGYWTDIGDITSYLRAQRYMIKRIGKNDGVNENYISPTSNIDKNVIINSPVFIGDNCNIYRGAEIGPYSVIGRNAIISNGAKVKRSIILDNAYIGDNVELKGAVIGKRVQMESESRAFEESIIGDDTLIRSRSIIKPSIRVWPSKEIDVGNIISSNLIWGGKSSKSLFRNNGVNGEVNVDITPEMVSKLGSAYGSIMKENSKVAISCSNSGAAQMFKYSIATGLMSMGIEVYDLKRMAINMARYTANYFGANGSIHISVNSDEDMMANIIFFTERGTRISTPLERNIENVFLREDFRRVKADSFKTITHLNDGVEYYIRQVVNSLNVDDFDNKKYCITFSCTNTILVETLKKILEQLNIKWNHYKRYNDLVGLKEEVISSKSNIGIMLNFEGDNLVLIDENGTIIDENEYRILVNFILTKNKRFKTIVATSKDSMALEEYAEKNNIKYVRCKSKEENRLNVYLKSEKNLSKKEIINRFLMGEDNIYICLSILEYTIRVKETVSSIVENFPQYKYKIYEINCSKHQKGSVMGYFTKNNNADSIEMTEGIRLLYKNGWILILPDAYEPNCRFYMEFKTDEDVEECKNYIFESMKSIIGENINVREY